MVIKQFRESGIDHVEIIADEYPICVFCRRFTTLKKERLKKLKKLNESNLQRS